MKETKLHLSPWLREISQLKPAKWNFSRSTRTCIAISTPMLLGYFTGTLMYTMWVSMGAMFPSIGERDAPYGFTIKKILISAPIGISGFLLGNIGWDWSYIVVLMALLAFVLSIASSYSATISIGCLQFMVMAAVSLGNSHINNHIVPVFFMLLGTLFYLCLLLLEKWLKPHQVRKDSILKTLDALLVLADKKARGLDYEEERLSYISKFNDLYTFMLQMRYQALGRNIVFDQTASIVQNIDNVFLALMSQADSEKIKEFSQNLQKIRNSFGEDLRPSDFSYSHGVSDESLDDLAASLWGGGEIKILNGGYRPKKISFKVLLEKLTPGRETLRSALALSFCTAIGYSMRWIDSESHWYWIPMTVAIVMKPELGSIFSRALQRTVGTAAGVVIGGCILAILPVGALFIFIIGAIAFVLPWLSQKNYALTAFAITPLVLVLIDFLAPAKHAFEYADLRLMDTLIGCAIVLIFGYLLWPKRHQHEFSTAMDRSWYKISAYLDVVVQGRDDPKSPKIGYARCLAYGYLVDMRATLQKSMAEPPPAGYEAAAWFPLVASAARLCDGITIYAGNISQHPDPKAISWLLQASVAMRDASPLPAVPALDPVNNAAEIQLIGLISKENAMRVRLYGAPAQLSSSQVHAQTP